MLINFQKKHGLVADGKFGPKTANKIVEVFKVKNPALFFGQICHESADLTLYIENLNYSANRLLQVFPKYFNLTNVNRYANKPIEIGNRVYGLRMGNKDANDGYKFRGRGAIQLTGKSNYKAFEKWLIERNLCKVNDLINNPDLVFEKFYIESAIFFFDVNNLWNITDVVTLTKRVNGGTNGLQDRINRTNKYKTWFNN